MMPHPPGCPACGGARPLRLVEQHWDRHGGRTYRLLDCPECGVVSSEPREAVGSDWYVRATPGRESLGALHGDRPAADWRFRQFFADRLPPGRLLDVGCGSGGFLALAARRGFRPTGFDYDERMVLLARGRGLDAHCAEFEAFAAAREAGEFDMVTLFDVLEHTPEPAWLLGQVKRLIRPGGHLAITLPNALRPLPYGREEHDFPPHHFTRWSPAALRHFLEREGFSVVRQEARTLKLRYLTDHFFFFRLAPVLLPWAKRLLGARRGPAAGSGPETAPAAGPVEASQRQRLVDLARFGFQLLAAPLALAQRAWYRSRQPDCGDCLYTLARKL